MKFDHTNKWYMHNLESAQKNETHKGMKLDNENCLMLKMKIGQRQSVEGVELHNQESIRSWKK